jgi:hypothetical protein
LSFQIVGFEIANQMITWYILQFDIQIYVYMSINQFAVQFGVWKHTFDWVPCSYRYDVGLYQKKYISSDQKAGHIKELNDDGVVKSYNSCNIALHDCSLRVFL